MNYKITSYATFDKEVKRLNKRYRSLKQDLATFVKELLQNPEQRLEQIWEMGFARYDWQ